MQIQRFGPAAGGAPVRACHQAYLAASPYRDPAVPPMPPRAFAGWLALGWTEDTAGAWLIPDGPGEGCAGWYVLRLPQRDNRHLAKLSLTVHPQARQAGRGTALLRHGVQRARAAEAPEVARSPRARPKA